MFNKLISVLITNYNYGPFLMESINSVYKQTKGTYEVIIIDDCSTDNSKSIIKVIQNDFNEIKIVLLPKNKGKLHALNIGIPMLSGEYTIILDADDFLDDYYCEKLIPFLEENPSLGFCYSDCNLVDVNKNFIARGKSISFDPILILSQSYIPECALTRTDLLKVNIPFDENIRVSTKHHKWKKIVTAGHSGYHLAEPLFYYRMHDRNLSGIGKRILKEKMKEEFTEKILSGYWSSS